MAVTLINVFSVPHGKEHEFVVVAGCQNKYHVATGVYQWKVPSEHQAGEPVQLHQCRVMGKRRGVLEGL